MYKGDFPTWRGNSFHKFSLVWKSIVEEGELVSLPACIMVLIDYFIEDRGVAWGQAEYLSCWKQAWVITPSGPEVTVWVASHDVVADPNEMEGFWRWRCICREQAHTDTQTHEQHDTRWLQNIIMNISGRKHIWHVVLKSYEGSLLSCFHTHVSPNDLLFVKYMIQVKVFICKKSFLSKKKNTYFWNVFKKLFEPAHEIMVLITWAISEGSGEPAHPRSLARAFTVRTHVVWK